MRPTRHEVESRCLRVGARPPFATRYQPALRCGSARAAIALSLLCSAFTATADNGNSPVQLREYIDRQVGGLQKLVVPANDADLPQPRLANGAPDPLFQITEAKRYLGKQLFHDPIRTARILPQFGGDLRTRQTASCGSCHQGESASKAGTLLNFAVGGEGRGYTDATGKFFPRRRPRSDLPLLRQSPLFAGDALVDEIPTLTDIYQNAVGSPARGRCCEPAGSTPWTASRAMHRARSAPPSTTAC